MDGTFAGSLDETFTLGSAHGSDLADAIASYLTQEYTADAAQFASQLKPGDEIAPGPRNVTVYDVVNNGVYITASFICQGDTASLHIRIPGDSPRAPAM